MTLAIHEIYHTMHSRIWIFGGLLCPNIRAIRQHHIWFMQQQHNRTYVWIMKGCDKDTFFFHLHLLDFGKKLVLFILKFMLWFICVSLLSFCLAIDSPEEKGLYCVYLSLKHKTDSFTEFGHKNEYLFTDLIFTNKTMKFISFSL